ncbi:hypothetical protein PTI98_000885 [Pleurotus ostreatus]|uniref:N-acetyltransferase domain-containing protein n=1 Tax=Pleurotus ostreatus (strain PC15) TaxID=1137138 RepID=A0A067P5K2_PLEO1|nr:hypothetical protein PTI98_000885 [Pleurotus ostreatus]KDQ31166.1 hypothetical protein PLEOSDRAFT_1082328 [Pleurotus ostreatus PC15]
MPTSTSGSHSQVSVPTNDSRSVSICHHDNPSDFLFAVSPSLTLQYETSAIVILAHAQKRITEPRPRDFWLTVWSTSPTTSRSALELILMCGSWLLGDYPIFLWAPPKAEYRSDATSSLVEFLRKRVPDKRVFSVFGPADITRIFTAKWSEATGIRMLVKPHYDAYLARCTKDTMRQGRSMLPLPQGHKTRLATMGDLDSVSELCNRFADEESAPYEFSAEDSRLEAQELIKAQQVWVYEASSGVIACICAAARHSHHASVISKVYTSKAFRSKGFAERLVRHVVQHLFSIRRESVVLYVGKNNSARRVYDRVGFSGIGDQAKSKDDREDWLEVGFDVAITGRW